MPDAAGDWPQYGHDAQLPHANPDEHVLSNANVGQLVAGWNVADASVTLPVEVGGHVYVEAGLSVRSYDAASGKLDWSYATNTPNADYAEPVAVVGGVVYAIASNGSRTTLDALDATTGKKLWSLPKLSGTPTISDGNLFLSSGNRLTSIDIATHRVNWTSTVGGFPAVANGHVYVANTTKVFSLAEATGAIEWTSKKLVTEIRDDIDTSITIANGLLYVATRKGVAYALDATTGAVRWSNPNVSVNYTTDIAAANGRVYIAGRDAHIHGYVRALDAMTGKQIWVFATGGGPYPIIATPTVANGVVYVGSTNKYMYALDAATGAKLWSFYAGISPVWEIVVSNGALYAGFYSGRLRTFRLPS